MFGRKKLGDLLVEAGKITKEQLMEVLRKQRASGKRLGELLVDDGIITEDEIMNVLTVQLKIKRAHLEDIKFDKNAISMVPEFLARKYNLIPLDVQEGILRVAMEDPLNIFAIDDVKISTGLNVETLISGKKEISSYIDRYYSNYVAEEMAKKLSEEAKSRKVEIDSESISSLEDIKNAPIVKLVDTIINNAVKIGVSDVHIEPFEEYVRVRYRVDGMLQETLRIPKESNSALTTRIKIMANLNIAEKRLPQDGRVVSSIDGTEVDLRVSILPTVYGEKIVIRILNKQSFMVDKKELGLNEKDIVTLGEILKSPFGIILVTGPTGSGKSTTLYSILKELNTLEKNIITVEDPVEYVMEGISQVNVNNKAGLNFASGLRSILRQDPDIVMIGEIRDNETAEIAIRAAITGHLVLSTIHTNDAASAVVRLIDMEVQPYLVSTAIAGIIAQRLVRKICPKCKYAYEANDMEKEILDIDKEERIILHKGEGCPFCNQKGYKGREAIFEVMNITKEHRESIQREVDVQKLRQINESNNQGSLMESCKNKVLQGITTLEELVRVVYMKE